MKITNSNGITFELGQEEFVANIICSPNASGSIFILRYINHQSKTKQLNAKYFNLSPNLINIAISESNQNFILLNNKFIIGKSDENSKNFDTIIFANSNIDNIEIPSNIKRIGSFSFYGHKNLKLFQFSEDS